LQVLGELVAVLGQAGGFFDDIDQPLHGDEDLQILVESGGGALWADAFFKHTQIGQAGQVDNRGGFTLDQLGPCRVGADQDCLDAGRWSNQHFAADIANHPDHPHQEGGGLLGRRVGVFGDDFREGLGHQGIAGAGQHAPDLLGDEGGERVEQFQGGLQDLQQYPPGLGLGGRILAVEVALDPLQVPVAELMPDELVEGRGGVVEAVFVQGSPGFGHRQVGTA